MLVDTLARKTWLDRQRYRPQQWATQQYWRAHDAARERWHGFDCLQPIAGLDLALVSLIGQTLGHAGVAVRTDRTWLLDAGDAYFYDGEMDVERPRCTPGLRFYQWLIKKDRRTRLANHQRLRELVRTVGAQVEIFCSHDLTEFERLAGVSADLPAGFVPAG